MNRTVPESAACSGSLVAKSFWHFSPMHQLFLRSLCYVALAMSLAGQVFAQEADSAASAQLSESDVAKYSQLQAAIDAQVQDIKVLEARMESGDPFTTSLLKIRRDKLWTAMFRDSLRFASEVNKQNKAGRDTSAYREKILSDLGSLPDDVYGAMERLRGQVVFPGPELEPEQLVVADQKLFAQINNLDEIFSALLAYIEIAGEFGLDSNAERTYLIEAVTESAANRSVFLENAIENARILQSSAETLPDSEHLRSWLRAVQTRVQLSASSMNKIVGIMRSLELESRQYRQQVLTVTGEITTDVLDFGIVANLASEWSKTLATLIAAEGPKLLFRLMLVAVILLGFFQLSKVAQKLTRHGLNSARISISSLLNEMIVASVRNLIVILGLLIAISQMGISLGPLLAGLGIAGFIIGFALQDTLGNFASGMLILLYRPFDVGDVVEAGGVRGRVSHMSLVNTTFMTLDNQRLVVPNNLIWSSVITNMTAQRTRRVDLIFGISYDDDIEKAERVLLSIVTENELVLAIPEPIIRVVELADSSVNIAVRPWVKTGDYWEVFWGLTKAVKLGFDAEGISIPYPQRDVHVKKDDSL